MCIDGSFVFQGSRCLAVSVLDYLCRVLFGLNIGALFCKHLSQQCCSVNIDNIPASLQLKPVVACEMTLVIQNNDDVDAQQTASLL